MFGNIKKQAEESQKRWDEIGKLAEELEDLIGPHGSVEEASRCTARLVLLLVKQFKPLGSMDTKAIEDGLKDILGSLTGGKTNE